jgi:hypothetical protein
VTIAPWLLPAAVSRPVALAYGGAIVLLGGLHAGDVSTNDIVRVDQARGRAVVVGALPLAVHDAGGAVLGGSAVVFAGGGPVTESAVQAWNGRRSAVIGALPVARSDLQAVALGGTDYVVGGFDGHKLVSSILATSDGRTFRTVGGLIQPVRYPAVAALAGKIYVVGGALSTSEATLSGAQSADVQRFDPATGKTSVIGHLPRVLSHAMALGLAGALYVFGGRTGPALSNEVWRIDASSGNVSRVGTMAQPISDAGAVAIGGVGYLLGGEVIGPSVPLARVEIVRVR